MRSLQQPGKFLLKNLQAAIKKLSERLDKISKE
jgi:hypothetical protein